MRYKLLRNPPDPAILQRAKILENEGKKNIKDNINEVQAFIYLVEAAKLYINFGQEKEGRKLLYLANHLPFMGGRDFYHRREFDVLAMGDGKPLKNLIEKLKTIKETYQNLGLKVEIYRIDELIRYLQQNYIKKLRKNPTLPAAIINQIKHAERLKSEAKTEVKNGNLLTAFIIFIQSAEIFNKLKMNRNFIETMNEAMLVAPITWETKSPRPLSDDITTLFWMKIDPNYNINRYNFFIENLTIIVKKLYEWNYRIQASKVEEFIKRLNKEVAPYINQGQTPGTKGPGASKIYPAGTQPLRHMPASTGKRSRIIKRH